MDVNVDRVPDIGDVSRIGPDADPFRDSELFRLPLQLERISRTSAIVADAENVHVVSLVDDAPGGLEEDCLSFEGNQAGNLPENLRARLLRDTEFPQHFSSGAGRLLETDTVRNHVHRWCRFAQETSELRGANVRIGDDRAAQPKIETPDGGEQDTPIRPAVIDLPQLELAVQRDSRRYTSAGCRGHGCIQRGLQVRVDEIGAGRDDELPEPRHGGRERGGGTGEFDGAQALNPAGVRQANLMYPDARVGEIPPHGTTPTLNRVLRCIQRHHGEAEATRIDGASEVEEAVFPSAKIQLRGDGEDIDQGSTLRVSNRIAPGQWLPLTEKSRSACAKAASSLTSTHGSRCG